MTFEQQISRAILAIQQRSSFFGVLVLFTTIRASTELPTAGTDGTTIFLNETFWSSLPSTQQVTVLLHEVLHVALGHITRRGARDAVYWNIAADVVVNGILAQESYSFPVDHIRMRNLEHLSVEEIYYELMKHQVSRDYLTNADLLTPAGPRPDQDRYWQQAIQQAQMVAAQSTRGTIPGMLQRAIRAMQPGQLDWRSYLWRYLVHTPSDFQGFDRRFIGEGCYLDGLEEQTLRVAVALDTSGSVDSGLIRQFLQEVSGIIRAYPHISIALYYADTACDGPYLLSRYNQEFPQPTGGGGTDFCPFFQRVQEQPSQYQPALCIYLTDGWGSFPEQPPALPTLWVIASGGIRSEHVPFGEVIRLVTGA